MRNSQNLPVKCGIFGSNKAVICSPHTQIAFAPSGERQSAAISAVLWCLWGIPVHLFLDYVQDVKGWSTFCTAAQLITLVPNSGCLLGVLLLRDWCYLMLKTTDEVSRDLTYTQVTLVDPDVCQKAARSEISLCLSQGAVSCFPVLQECSYRITEHFGFRSSSPAPLQWAGTSLD